MADQRGTGRQKAMSAQEMEYRHRLEVKEQKRKQRTKQKLILLGAFIVFAAMVITAIVLIVKAIQSGGDNKPSRNASSLSAASGAAHGVTWPVAEDPNAWNLILINNQVAMPQGFAPEMVAIDDAGNMLDARAADALKQMVADCNAVEGHNLSVASAYRGEQAQNDKYNFLVGIYKDQVLAEGKTEAEAAKLADEMARETDPPFGHSDHQTALSVDFIGGNQTEPARAFSETDEYIWLLANAPNYGFILRFPESKVNITGITPQPYHFRYVGVEDAKTISGAGICLEEYLTKMPAATTPSLPAGPEGQTSVP